MTRLGILTGADLVAQSLPFLEAHFGSFATYLYLAARGRDDRPVRANRVRKSVGAERTFFEDIQQQDALEAALDPILDALMERVERAGSTGRTVTLKVKFADFHQITRARSFVRPIGTREAIAEAGRTLLAGLCPMPKGVRLLGLSLSALAHGDGDEEQLGLML